MSAPRISIVVVTLNARDVIDATAESIRSQQYPHTELIVIDGGSEDGTLERLASSGLAVDHLVSEPDEGIYDAMNKGVNAATGDYVIFMNAGDAFAHPDALATLALAGNADIVYGDAIVVYDGFERYAPAGSMKNLWKEMIFSHQSAISRTELLKRFPFRSDAATAADYGFFANAAAHGSTFLYSPAVVSRVSAGGVSDVRRFSSIAQRAKLSRILRNDAISRWYYRWLRIDTALRMLLKMLLPKNVQDMVLKRK